MADIRTDTFVDYVKTRHLSRDVMVEDFVAEAVKLIDTGTFPNVLTWNELYIYLQAQGVSLVAIEGARRCLRNFDKLRQRRSRSS
jgi:hypothetical protein